MFHQQHDREIDFGLDGQRLSLSVSVDGGPDFLLFDNVLAKFSGKEQVSFVPAVTVSGAAEICFGGFK